MDEREQAACLHRSPGVLVVSIDDGEQPYEREDDETLAGARPALASVGRECLASLHIGNGM